MNTFIALLVLAAAVALLVSYARHDRFAGPASTTHPIDDLGPIEERQPPRPALLSTFRRARITFCLT